MGDEGKQCGISPTTERHNDRPEAAHSVAETIERFIEQCRVDAVDRREI